MGTSLCALVSSSSSDGGRLLWAEQVLVKLALLNTERTERRVFGRGDGTPSGFVATARRGTPSTSATTPGSIFPWPECAGISAALTIP